MSEIPPPPSRCPACGAGHHVAVRFCPFCGAAQEPPAVRPEPPRPAARTEPATAYLHLDAPLPRPAARPPSAAPSPIPTVPPPPRLEPPRAPPREAPRPLQRWRLAPTRRRFGLRSLLLALLAIAGLAALALAQRDALPAPARIDIGPAWTAVALGPFRGAPLLRLTGDGPFSLRLDGERVLRVAPGGGATLRLRSLSGLELRTGRGSVTVTLTPRRG